VAKPKWKAAEIQSRNRKTAGIRGELIGLGCRTSRISAFGLWIFLGFVETASAFRQVAATPL
jgi:hypothetical protein